MSIYCNVWPEAVYCCFTRTALITTLFHVGLHDPIIMYGLRPFIVVLHELYGLPTN